MFRSSNIITIVSCVVCLFMACNSVDPHDMIDNANDNGADSTSTPIASVYGDGSAGSRVITGDIRLGDQGDTNLQYTDFSVQAGVTLTVQSGTVIRCRGRFQNFGTIVVQTGTEGGLRMGFDSSTIDGVSVAPQAGIATRAAGNGEIGNNNAGRSGGGEGSGLSEFESIVTLDVGVLAGGGGGAAMAAGASGGGSFSVIAAGEIIQDGVIMAPGGDGADGGGGGGGGVVVLASQTRITNTSDAVVMADGGAGGDATSESASGGGGGGGIVHFIAPEIDDFGDVSAFGGSPGATGSSNSITSSMRSGGGGGGASGGTGGRGGDIPSGETSTPESASAGSDGFVLESLVDPTALF